MQYWGITLRAHRRIFARCQGSEMSLPVTDVMIPTRRPEKFDNNKHARVKRQQGRVTQQRTANEQMSRTVEVM